MSIYRDPILQKVVDLLDAEGPAQFKGKYYFGDPIVVNQSELPCAFVSVDRERTIDASNAEIETKIDVVLNLVWDHSRDFQQQLDNIEGHMTLVDIIAGRNEDYTFKQESLVSILRKHQELDTKLWIDLGSETDSDFGFGIEKRGPGIYTVEGVLRFSIRHNQLKPEYI